MSGEISQIAIPTITTPNTCFTDSIQGPDLGSTAPPVAPMRSSGSPIPKPMKKSATPPCTTSRVWEM